MMTFIHHQNTLEISLFKNNMRKSVITFFILLLLTLSCCQGKRGPVSEEHIESDSSVIAQEPEMSDTIKSVVTTLPYWKYREDIAREYSKHKKEFEKNPLYQAYYEICLVNDTMDNVVRKSYSAGGLEDDEYIYPHIYFWICLEMNFGNSQVFKSMEQIIDTTVIKLCSYWEPKKRLHTIRKNNMPHDVNGIFRFVERIAQYITNDKQVMNRIRDEHSACVHVVCRKVYETSDIVTYGLYSYVDYHGPCGNNSRIRYYTVDKRSDHVLSVNELLEKYSKEQLNRKLLEEYKSVAYYVRENADSVDYVSVADGCAILKDGTLFYYLPYNLGCGAEGQYNLVVQP